MRWTGILGLAVMLAASLATRMPSAERQAFFDALHRPNGNDVMQESVP